MTTEATPQHTLALSDKERKTLVEILEEVLKETRVEEHRTEARAAREVMRGREATIESLLHKVRETGPA